MDKNFVKIQQSLTLVLEMNTFFTHIYVSQQFKAEKRYLSFLGSFKIQSSMM